MKIIKNMSPAQTIKHVLAHQAAKYFLRATLVEGNLKNSNQRFRSLFIGNSQFVKYLLKRTYQGQPDILKRWRVWIPSIKKMIIHNSAAADLCVAVLPRKLEKSFKGHYTYKGTELVRQVIPTTGEWEDIRKKFSSKKRRIANHFGEKFGLGYRISRDDEDLKFFYAHMFLPLLTKRYGELADIETLEEMRKFFQKGFLLFVTKDGRDLAGNLCLVEDNVLMLRRAGVLDGDEAYVEAGAQTALYYFGLKYANEQGLRAADAMMSASFLNDGVYVTKKEWGAVVSPSDDFNTWAYFFNLGPADKLAQFYDQNPFIAQAESGLKGLLGTPIDSAPTPEALEPLLRQYRSEGLTSFIVHTPAGTMEIS